MLPQNPLPQLILPRVQSAVQRLSDQIWELASPLIVEATAPQPTQCSLKEGKSFKRSVQKSGSFWGKLFDQRWCRIAFDAPTGKNDWLHWQDQGEATLYINDQPFWGFNVAHDHCLLPQGIQQVWIQSTCVQSAIWHPEANGMASAGALFKGATLVQRNHEAWHSYHDLKCLFDLALDRRTRETPEIPEVVRGTGLQPKVVSYSPAYRRLLRWTDEAIDVWETKGLSAMRTHLAKAYRELKVDAEFSTCLLTGHAHVDLVWIWPERIGELKAINVFATANRLMDEYPEFRFAYSQPASYEAVKHREPGLYDAVSKRIKDGTWQATGAMYVESDTLIACGEALSRSFEIGQNAFREINGAPSKLTWLPDVFGYSTCLPQIMVQHGVKYFFTTKMTWNAVNQFPYSSFVWKGNDGSEILAHITQASNYVTHMKVNDLISPMKGNMQAAVHEEFLLPTGYGDGGGGTTATMLERARRLDGLPGLPSLKWGQPEEFFDRLSTKRSQFPTHQGECYLEYHRGTYTTHSNLKALFRNLERALQLSEAVSVATGKTIDTAHSWKRLVFAQFHDYIPGSSVWDVYQEGLPELKNLADEQHAFCSEILSTKKEKNSCLFNPHAVPVQLWYSSPSGEFDYLRLPAARGTSLSSAKLDLPAPVELKGHKVSNDRTSFKINNSGWINSLTWDGIEVPMKEPLGQLMLYPDQAANFEAWEIDRQTLSLGTVCKSKAEIKVWQEGEHRKGFRISRAVGKASHASVLFYLEAGSPLVHIKIDLDWQDYNSLLKLRFPTRYGASHARFGAPFGSVLRPQLPCSMIAEAMWEVPFSRYLAVFDDGERQGLFITTQDKYGACVRDGDVGISLVRSPRVTGMENHKFAWPPHLSRLKDTPEHSDLGDHHIQMAFGRYALDLSRTEQPAMVADTLFTTPVPYKGSETPILIEEMQGGDTLVPHWIQPSENGGWILRLHEVAGQRGELSLIPAKGWSPSRVQLDRSASPEKIIKNKVRFQPYQVVSIAFQAI